MPYVHYLVMYLNEHQQFMVFRSTNDVDSHVPLFSYTNLRFAVSANSEFTERSPDEIWLRPVRDPKVSANV